MVTLAVISRVDCQYPVLTPLPGNYFQWGLQHCTTPLDNTCSEVYLQGHQHFPNKERGFLHVIVMLIQDFPGLGGGGRLDFPVLELSWIVFTFYIFSSDC